MSTQTQTQPLPTPAGQTPGPALAKPQSQPQSQSETPLHAQARRTRRHLSSQLRAFLHHWYIIRQLRGPRPCAGVWYYLDARYELPADVMARLDREIVGAWVGVGVRDMDDLRGGLGVVELVKVVRALVEALLMSW